MHRLDPESLPGHLDALYRAARGLSASQADAEDLAQETIARVLARPRLVRGDDRVYLMRALRNTHANQRRTDGRRPLAANVDADELAERRSAAPSDDAIAIGEVYAAVAELPEALRLAIVAVDFLGLSYEEAGRALGIGRGTIATRVHRGRERLATQLRPPVADPVAVRADA